MNIDTDCLDRLEARNISKEALHHLQVESAAGRGLRIECRARVALPDDWEPKMHPWWNWERFDYRIAKPEPGKRTRAELMDQLTTLIAELKELDA